VDTAGKVWIYAVGSGEGANGIVRPSYTDVEQFTYSGGDKDHGDIILLKFNSDVSTRIWGTYLGKILGQERGHEVTVDSFGNVYIVGTMSEEYTGEAKGSQVYQTIPGGQSDAFLSQWTQDGKMNWLTYYGGPENERGRDVKTDRDGNVYIVGKTMAASIFPNSMVSSSNMIKASSSAGSDNDGYLAKFNFQRWTDIWNLFRQHFL
jgi:hypothetical protein